MHEDVRRLFTELSGGGHRYLDAFVGTPTGAPVANFERLVVGDCAQCHFTDGAAADCLTCHAYHRRPGSASYRSALAEVR